MTTPLCKDCRFYRKSPLDENGQFDTCERPVGTSPVTGKPQKHRWPYCKQQRDQGRFDFFAWRFGMCAEHGRYFEKREPL